MIRRASSERACCGQILDYWKADKKPCLRSVDTLRVKDVSAWVPRGGS